MTQELTRVVSPTADPRKLRAADGTILTPPAGWELLPPGDAGLTRRVKDAGPSWTVVVVKGRKKFSQGVWAPAEHIAVARAALEKERATEAYARRREADAQRRELKQAEYVEDFEQEVLNFLKFSKRYAVEARKFAAAVTLHATPVGSGTVARTERIPLEERVEAAVIAWMRHQTTAYDQLSIARVKGKRQETRQELAKGSRRVLDAHRREEAHGLASCPLCRALARLELPGVKGAAGDAAVPNGESPRT